MHRTFTAPATRAPYRAANTFIRTAMLMTTAALLSALAACGDTATPMMPETVPMAGKSVTTTPVGGPWARIVEGETGPGALYALYIPRTWNGDAVYYAHGFRDADSPVDLRDQDGLFVLRDQLGAQGYAVAYSSYAQNGFAVKDGGKRTHQLRGKLASELPGQPVRNYLLGHSLGGGIALDLAERYPTQYDGALLVCGMVGGSLLETQYLGHVRTLFDFFYPNKVPGSVLGVPGGTVVTIPQVISAVGTNPLALFAIASTAQTPLPFVPSPNPTDPSSATFQTLVGSLYGALSFHARGINNILDLTHGHQPFDNATTTYAMGTPVLPAPFVGPLNAAISAANAGVGRYTADQSAQNYLTKEFTPTGDLRFPVLTLHNMWDPAVPAFHETALRQAAIAAGADGNLVQRLVPTYGHCNIPVGTVAQSFTDLAIWVTTGVKP